MSYKIIFRVTTNNQLEQNMDIECIALLINFIYAGFFMQLCQYK
jgi:hypothetical protein